MKYFVTIVRCGSFTEAAEECFISQSAISQQIKALEKEFGVELMHRQNRSFILTPAGEYFYRHCLGVLDEIERIKSETIQIGEYDDQTLSIGLMEGLSFSEIRKAIAKFASLYPEVEIDIKTGSHEDLFNYMQSDEVDIKLNDQRRAFSDLYVNFHLMDQPFYVGLSPQNPLADLDYLTIDDLRRLPCIIVASSSQEDTERDYYHNNIGFGNNFIFVRNQETANLMVAANKGFNPNDGYRPQRETIVYKPLYEGKQPLIRHYYLFWKKNHTNYYIEEFANILYNIYHPEEND